MKKILLLFLSIVSMPLCAYAPKHLPSLPTIQERMLQLHRELDNRSPDQPETRHIHHEMSRLLFVTYLLDAHRSKQEVRIAAHHAFTQLYQCACSDQTLLRDLLSRFVQELFALKTNVCNRTKHNTALITRCCQLEESVMPLLKEYPASQESLHTFTTSMYHLVSKSRITKTHIALFTTGSLLVAGLSVSFLALRSKITEAQERIINLTLRAEQRHADLIEHSTKAITQTKDMVDDVITAANKTKAPGKLSTWLAKTFLKRQSAFTDQLAKQRAQR